MFENYFKLPHLLVNIMTLVVTFNILSCKL